MEERVITEEMLISYLHSQMDDFKEWESHYGLSNRIVEHKLDAMIACKEMVESLICQPVNLKKDGVVTVGF